MNKGHIKLCEKNLPTLKAAGIHVPIYDRSKMREGIVHFGVGGFHRAHLAQYIHMLATEHNVMDWSICGVGLMPSDIAMRDALVSQDCLYTVIEGSAEGSKIHVVGSITSYMYAPTCPERVIAKLAHPDTRIVSLTITESGYCLNDTTKELDTSHPSIAADLQVMAKGGTPTTVYGYIVAGLARRHKLGLPPFTILSCDNIVQNGQLLKKMVLSFTEHIDRTLAAWLDSNGAFPNSMVDRITPRTRPDDVQRLARRYNVIDAWPVVTEPFIQWVMEDNFTTGRPPWEKVGVQIADDVEPFEKMKLSLLNGTHSAIGYLAHLTGYEYIHEAIRSAEFRKYIRGMMDFELRPLLDHVPGIDMDKYCDSVIERFSNPTLGDRVLRICQDGSGKMPKYILSPLSKQLEQEGEFSRLSLCVAAWFRFLNGIDEWGKEYVVDDPMAAQLQLLAIDGGPDARGLLGVQRLFDETLQHSAPLLKKLNAQLESLYRYGARATLIRVLEAVEEAPEVGTLGEPVNDGDLSWRLESAHL
ncbi:hypothetical protein AC578_9716 [Pseudocercospora eumusae]|uniref:Mannitol 2-dehydrogenase n=1 Tax=Pseudocercospora eumusae TaxID=321146 RepID=A0A139HQU4_9PEZI|nr:hypothetical protein AC578_9716 [Pseudocercospora eumusae]